MYTCKLLQITNSYLSFNVVNIQDSTYIHSIVASKRENEFYFNYYSCSIKSTLDKIQIHNPYITFLIDNNYVEIIKFENISNSEFYMAYFDLKVTKKLLLELIR